MEQQTKSICQDCFNFGCSWHEEFKAVKGWKAVPTKIMSLKRNKVCEIKSYQVIKCPKYKSRNTYRKEMELLESD